MLLSPLVSIVFGALLVFQKGDAATMRDKNKILQGLLSSVDPKPILRFGVQPNSTTPKLNSTTPWDKINFGEFLRLSAEEKRREARLIIGALNKQSCFAKVLCGLGSQAPSKNTNLLNDYAYLVGDLLIDSEEDGGKGTSSGGIFSDIFDIDEFEDSSKEDDENAGLDLKKYRRDPRPQPHGRYGKRLRQGAAPLPGSRECRQLQEAQVNKCPYDDAQVKGITRKLTKIIKGEDSLNMITMTALDMAGVGGGSAKGSIQRPSGSSGKMNVVINLQQNLTLPHQGGFAALPLPLLPIHHNNQEGVQVDGVGRNNTNVEDNVKQFYLFPLTTPAAVHTEPTEPPTTTPEPYEQLLSFLYAVGYAQKSTESTTTTTTKKSPPLFPPKASTLDDNPDDSSPDDSEEESSGTSQRKRDENEEDDEEEEAEGSEEEPKTRRKFVARDEENFVKIRSHRNGRFHAVEVSGGEEESPVEVHSITHSQLPVPPRFPPTPTPQFPILFKMIQLFSSIFRGGPMGGTPYYL